MSNPIPYDSLLVHYLAVELDGRLAQRRLHDVRMDGEARRLVLVLEDETLVWDLHPDRGWLLRADTPPVQDPASHHAGRLALPRQAHITGVEAPRDERLLLIGIGGKGKGRTHRLAVELMTNQWNALALDGAGRIMAALWPRQAGDRVLRPGVAYAPPAAPEPRAGRVELLSLHAWHSLLAGVDPAERRRALVRRVAWASPLNSGAILGAADRGAAGVPLDAQRPLLEGAYDRYRAIATLPPAQPHVLRRARGPFPYPIPLPGMPGEGVGSLVEAMAAASEGAGAAPALTPGALDRLRQHRQTLARRLERLRAELERAPDQAAALRRQADVLLTRLHAVPRGAEHVVLEDFEGGTVEIDLDPALPPAANADRLYDEASRRERAAHKLPALVEAAAAELDWLDRLLADAQAGRPDAAAVRAVLAGLEATGGRKGRSAPSLPYRRYRTSGGLEVRVGRGSRANDALTFHHSAPDDIWLHARDVAGAHVVLRWSRHDQNPPRRDLHEAAALAAWHSRARTAGTVPVDWTRRKYVRKPKGAPPGLVRPDRVQTVFVEPAGALERKLRDP
ncbi:MAG TPA: NFACT RNA binding domain-containing protein [Longimicrobiales bacterium]|nr:NFACT RNA binding domain-containing protein [Longimicrobiales bacterium]